MISLNLRLVPVLALGFVSAFESQADVTSWRNGGNGEYPVSRLPIDWKANILWETPLQASSNASPLLVDGRLYFCQEPSILVCVDSRSGDTLWERATELVDLLDLTEEERAKAENIQERYAAINKESNRLDVGNRRLQRRLSQDKENQSLKDGLEKNRLELDALIEQKRDILSDPAFGGTAVIPTHPTNGYASFTPVSDGKLIYSAFGQGILVAYDLDGNIVWRKRMEAPNHSFGGSTSPLIVDGKLIVRFADYTALDLGTGDEIWRVPSEVSWGTPSVFEVEGESFLFTPRAEVIRVSDGRKLEAGLVELDREFPWSAVNTPIVKNGIIYTAGGFDTAPNKGHCFAFRIPKKLSTMYSAGLTQLWHSDLKGLNYYASPVIYDGLVYAMSQDALLSVLEATTGAIVYEHKVAGLKGISFPSICVAGDTLFFGSDDGHLIAMQPGREYKELARSQFDMFRSTPIFEGNNAYLRTYEHLYAIGSD